MMGRGDSGSSSSSLAFILSLICSKTIQWEYRVCVGTNARSKVISQWNYVNILTEPFIDHVLSEHLASTGAT